MFRSFAESTETAFAKLHVSGKNNKKNRRYIDIVENRGRVAAMHITDRPQEQFALMRKLERKALQGITPQASYCAVQLKQLKGY